MELFTDLDEFVRITADRPRWRRTAQAIRAAAGDHIGVMHSIGDSLTYLRTHRRYETELFTGHRRYLEVIAAGQSPVLLEVASKAELERSTEYSDLSDREHFIGTGHRLTLQPGQIVVIGINEAVRHLEPAAEPCTVLHVSVEGATFPNK